MAHFAQLNENNIVTNVLVVSNDDIQNLPFPQSEPIGVVFLQNLFPNTTWKQTSYNNNFRFKYAGIGYEFHSECGTYGGFSTPPDYSYFIFQESTCSWISSVPYPNDGFEYYWNHSKYSWIKIPTTTVIG